MAERAHGFSLPDHRRVSNVTRKAEAGDFDPPTIPGKKPPARALVRVMILESLGDTNTGIPDPIKGDFLMDGISLMAVITESTKAQFGGRVHYVVRCVASDQSSTPRTWQLRVIPPERGAGMLTAAIDEHATGEAVAAAINATGCPPCLVYGSENYLTADDGTQVSWPDRQWHIIWPDNDWQLTTLRPVDIGDGATGFEYEVGDNEVPIALIPTAYAPTPFCEEVFLPYSTSFAAPTPGTFALCQVFPGLGLMLVNKECWTYVD